MSAIYEIKEFDRRHVALITGITGQDGGYLTEFLLDRGYAVHGIARDLSAFAADRFERLAESRHRLILHSCDMTDGDRLHRLVEEIAPDEVYNLAAQSHVHKSFDVPDYTADVNTTGAIRLLDAVHKLAARRAVRFYQASSSEIFGHARGAMQNEETPFHPLSPYAVSKHAAFVATVHFREAYGLHASNGILFNHESPYRKPAYVTRKISAAVAAHHLGSHECLRLGNLDTRRDWGHARDYIEGMWLMLQQPSPDDYVLATGENHSVRDFVGLAYRQIGREIVWRGAGVEETGVDARTGETLVAVDPRFFRPTDVSATLGDASKARRLLGWRNKTGFPALVREMVEADIARLEQEELALKSAGE